LIKENLREAMEFEIGNEEGGKIKGKG